MRTERWQYKNITKGLSGRIKKSDRRSWRGFPQAGRKNKYSGPPCRNLPEEKRRRALQNKDRLKGQLPLAAQMACWIEKNCNSYDPQAYHKRPVFVNL
jgi:hypothetical protein